MIDVLKGLEILNQLKITHFNVTPESILIKGDKAFLSDYFLSSIFDLWDLISKGIYDTNFSNFITPEIWKGNLFFYFF
jgi:hypothetical protein